MKFNIISKALLVITLFFVTSCKEYFVTTRINSDGTIVRAIILKGSENGEAPESWLKSTGWNISVFRDSGSTEKKIKAEKTFESFGGLTGNSAFPENGFKPGISITVDKQFKFFFTYYTYKETYKPFNPYKNHPIEEYFNKEEVEKLKAGTDSAWVKEKLDEYNGFNLVEKFYTLVEEKMLSQHQIRLSNKIAPERKKEFLRELLTATKSDKEGDKIKETTDKYFDKSISNLIKNYVDDKEITDKLFSPLSEYDGQYQNSVLMPGIITSSNSSSIEGNRISWKFDQEKFKYFEYEMRAESREANTWVIIVSAIIVILLVLGLAVPKMRKKPSF